jgi:hypothetical protein
MTYVLLYILGGFAIFFGVVWMAEAVLTPSMGFAPGAGLIAWGIAFCGLGSVIGLLKRIAEALDRNGSDRTARTRNENGRNVPSISAASVRPAPVRAPAR